MQLGGGNDAAQNQSQAANQVPVVGSTRQQLDVVEDNHQRANAQEAEHQHGHPEWANPSRCVVVLRRGEHLLTLRASPLLGDTAVVHAMLWWLSHERKV